MEVVKSIFISLGIIIVIGLALLSGIGGVFVVENGLPSTGWFVEAENAPLAPDGDLAAELEAVRADRHNLIVELVELMTERDALVVELETAMAERDANLDLAQQADIYAAQIASLEGQRDHAIAAAEDAEAYAQNKILSLTSELTEAERLNRAYHRDIDYLAGLIRDLSNRLAFCQGD